MATLAELQSKKKQFINFRTRIQDAKESLGKAKGYLDVPEHDLKLKYKIDDYDADRSSVTKFKSGIDDNISLLDNVINSINVKLRSLDTEIQRKIEEEALGK